jgi:hypothetical protein
VLDVGLNDRAKRAQASELNGVCHPAVPLIRSMRQPYVLQPPPSQASRNLQPMLSAPSRSNMGVAPPPRHSMWPRSTSALHTLCARIREATSSMCRCKSAGSS